MLKLKLQYLGHLMQRTDSFEKTLMLGKIEGRRKRGDRGWDGWMASLTQWTWIWASSRKWYGNWQGHLAFCSPWCHKHLDVTELNWEWAWWKTLTSTCARQPGLLCTNTTLATATGECLSCQQHRTACPHYELSSSETNQILTLWKRQCSTMPGLVFQIGLCVFFPSHGSQPAPTSVHRVAKFIIIESCVTLLSIYIPTVQLRRASRGLVTTVTIAPTPYCAI